MKPFDKQFADRVREAFDRHEEPFDPAAWEDMKSRLAKSPRQRVIALFSATMKVAASLLIFSMMTWLALRLLNSGTETIIEMRQALSSDQAQEVFWESGPVHPGRDTTARDPDDNDRYPDQDDPQWLPGRKEAVTSIAGLTRRDDQPPAVATESDPEPVALALQDEAAAPEQHPDMPHAAFEENEILETPLPQTPGRQMQDVYANDMPPSYLKEDKNDVLNWGVVAGPMLTYAGHQLARGLGFSGGLTSEYSLTEHLGLSSGLILAYQQFEMEQGPRRHYGSEMDYSPDQSAVRTYGDYTHEILALDIPLNVQFRLQGRKNRQWIFATGLSSLLFLQQNMSGLETAYAELFYYDGASNEYRSISSTHQAEVYSEYEPFARFDFARLLNLSIGYAIKREKTTTIIEPFVKYPLGDLSSREIKMGMGGVSLRLTFNK